MKDFADFTTVDGVKCTSEHWLFFTSARYAISSFRAPMCCIAPVIIFRVRASTDSLSRYKKMLAVPPMAGKI